MAEISIYAVASAIPEPNPAPTFPAIFLCETKAEAHLERELKSEWEFNAPEDDFGAKRSYPGNWRDAQNAILEDRRGSDGEGWGSYELTIHRLEVSLTHLLMTAIRKAFRRILKPFTRADV